MNQKEKTTFIRRSILDSVNHIETLTGKMFHELMPEVDREFHELIYNDYLRLRALDVNLKHYIDDLKFDRGQKHSTLKTNGDK